VIDLSSESLGSGVERVLGGKGVDIVIDSIGGEFTGQALAALAPGGGLVILGYSAGRRAVIDVTDLIWKGARIESFTLFAQPSATIADAECHSASNHQWVGQAYSGADLSLQGCERGAAPFGRGPAVWQSGACAIRAVGAEAALPP